MPNHYISTVFETDILRIENFCCCGAEHSGEEMATSHEIVFPRHGAFERSNAYGKIVADANHVLFFHQNQPYQIRHPVPGGDTSTIIALNPSVLLDMVQTVDPTVEERPDAPFTAGHSLAESQHHIRLHRLLKAASTGIDPLEIEESALTFAASVIQQSYQAANRRQWRTRSDTTEGRRDVVNRVKIVLAARFRDKLSLNQLARETFTSAYHLCRVFKDETGLPIHRYLLRLRLTHALEDIAENPNVNLTRVALNLGFNSHSHFTAAFQQTFGIAPSRFARESSARSVRELSQ